MEEICQSIYSYIICGVLPEAGYEQANACRVCGTPSFRNGTIEEIGSGHKTKTVNDKDAFKKLANFIRVFHNSSYILSVLHSLPTSMNTTAVKIYSAVYSGVSVFEMNARGIAVMRRRSDSYLNATQILKVAGIEKGKRTKILEREVLIGEHEKVQGGYGKYQGTWYVSVS